jgi:hypothetical protein
MPELSKPLQRAPVALGRIEARAPRSRSTCWFNINTLALGTDSPSTGW